ncbi:NfeD family protein [Gayadomonas joobiniege]|uniref:NfeD family protein n=1 Tax=Gayadomonas joobiniege TaxID=1234606 RepID=UPI00036AC6FA|nr:NfeD family protein [Gayadomonas joobiniege]
MIENLSNYSAEALIALGIILLAIEVGILGFATFILFFIGLALIINGILIWLTIVPDQLSWILLTTALLSAVLALVLWKPLQRLQNTTEQKNVHSDFVGITFFTQHPIDRQGLSTHSYSGIQWKLKSEQPIAAGSEVTVVRAEVGTFWVKPVV